MRRLLLVLTLAFAPSCSSPFGGRDIDLGFSARAGPGVGGSIELAQRVGELAGRRVDVELVFAHDELANTSSLGNDYTQVWGGVRFAPLEPGAHFYGRFGVTWVRTEAETASLDFAGDYGGGYVGAGYLWSLSPSLATGPDVSAAFVDAEGDIGGSAALLQAAWRLVWHL